MAKQTHFRDSDTGRFLKESDTKRLDPKTWEKEIIKYPPPPKKK